MDLRLRTAETVPMAPRDLDAGFGKGVLPLVPAAAPPAEAAFLTLLPRPRRPAPASAGVTAGEAPATAPPPSDAAAALRVLPERAEGAREVGAAAPVETAAAAAAFDLLDAPLDCDGAAAAAAAIAACCCCCCDSFGCCWEPPAPPPASERVRPERVWRGEPVGFEVEGRFF